MYCHQPVKLGISEEIQPSHVDDLWMVYWVYLIYSVDISPVITGGRVLPMAKSSGVTSYPWMIPVWSSPRVVRWCVTQFRYVGGSEVIGDTPVTMGFKTKSWSCMTGWPHDSGNLRVSNNIVQWVDFATCCYFSERLLHCVRCKIHE